MEKIAKLGTPSYLWQAGQERRLQMIRKHVPLKKKKILDIGCGVGTYLQAFKQFGGDLYGIDIDTGRVTKAKKVTKNVFVAPAEKLPFEAETFDIVLLNEVLEHVNDDRKAIEEAIRVLKPGGHIVIFAPNRLFPFETHGFYWRGKYVFGNIPLINYLPNSLRNRLAPHVRAYTTKNLKKLLADLRVRIVVFTQVYPGFDKIFARIPLLGNLLRRFFYSLERTPLCIFGLSHFVIVRKKTPDPSTNLAPQSGLPYSQREPWQFSPEQRRVSAGGLVGRPSFFALLPPASNHQRRKA